MPDPTNNPPGPGGPARDASTTNDDARALHSSLSDLAKATPQVKEISNLLKAVSDVLDKSDKSAESIQRRMKDWGSELRQVVAFSDDIEDHMKAIGDYQRKMAKEGLKASSYKEVADILETMKEHTEALAKKGVLSKDHGRILSRQVREMEAGLKSLKGKVEDAFDPKVAEDMLGRIGKIGKATMQVASQMKGLRITGLQRDLAGAERAMSHLFQRSSSRLEKWNKYAQTGNEIRVARQKRDQGKQEEFKAHREHIMRRLPSLNIDTKKYLRPDGSVDEDAVRSERARRKEKITDMVLKRSAERGITSPLATGLLTNAAMARAGGGTEGLLTRAGLGLATHGEGSVGRGLLSWGSSMAEGGAGGIASMAGEVAPVLAILEAIKMAFDKNQKMNSEAAEGIGQGGIFGGDNDAITSLGNVRKNLNSQYIYSRLGIGYDKNLAIAKTMAEGGFSTQNLSQAPIGHEGGFLKGSFGTMQRNTYAFGKLAGLNPGQTMTETLKLITQFRQSLGSTEDFFVKINRDTRAAGISTMKYIQIIDDVNSQYDRSNKLLMTTVTVMRTLSQTGRDTADDLKDAMDTITNGGQQQPMERSAYLNMLQLQNPEERQRLVGVRQDNFEDAARKAAQALGMNETDVIAGMQKQGYNYIATLKMQADKAFGGDTTRHQAAIGAINTAQQAYGKYQYTQRAANLAGQGRLNQAGLGLAAATENTGADLVSNSTETLNALRSALHIAGFTLADFMNKGKRPEIDSSVAFAKGKEFYGLNKVPSDRLQNVIEDASASVLETLQKGITAEDAKDPQVVRAKQDLYEKIYSEFSNQGVKFGAAPDHATAVQRFAKGNESETLQRLTRSSTLIDAIFGSKTFQRINNPKMQNADKEAALRDAEKLAANTRPTAEIFADAFTYLFNLLAGPLNTIARVLTGHFGLGPKDHWASDTDKKQLQMFDKLGYTTQAMKATQDQITSLQAQADAEKDDKKKAALQAEADAKKEQLTKNETTLSTFHTGNGVFDDDMRKLLGQIKDTVPDATPQLTSKQQMDQFLSSLDVKWDDKKQSGVISDETERTYHDQLTQLQKTGDIKLNKVLDLKTGLPDQYVITTTNHFNSVDFTQYGSGVRGMGNASESPNAPSKNAQAASGGK